MDKKNNSASILNIGPILLIVEYFDLLSFIVFGFFFTLAQLYARPFQSIPDLGDRRFVCFSNIVKSFLQTWNKESL
jgi:hypothetical protein